MIVAPKAKAMDCSASVWVQSEFTSIDLGDERLNWRFKRIVTRLAKHCGKTLASSFNQWKEIKASYRFFANPKVKESEMLGVCAVEISVARK